MKGRLNKTVMVIITLIVATLSVAFSVALIIECFIMSELEIKFDVAIAMTAAFAAVVCLFVSIAASINIFKDRFNELRFAAENLFCLTLVCIMSFALCKGYTKIEDVRLNSYDAPIVEPEQSAEETTEPEPVIVVTTTEEEPVETTEPEPVIVVTTTEEEPVETTEPEPVIVVTTTEEEPVETTEPEEHTHNYVEMVVNPTCTEQGCTRHVCACGDEYDDGYTEALGHDYIGETTISTCTDNGTIVYTCTRCGDTYVEEVECLGHTIGDTTIENVVAPACTECGSYEKVLYCDVCGKELSRITYTTEATGHKYEATTIEPTYESGGYTVYCCENCGDKFISNYTEKLVKYVTVTILVRQEVNGRYVDKSPITWTTDVGHYYSGWDLKNIVKNEYSRYTVKEGNGFPSLYITEDSDVLCIAYIK